MSDKREEKFQETFKDMKKISREVETLLESIIDETKLRSTFLKQPQEKSINETIPFFFAYALNVLFHNNSSLAENSQHLSVAIISRSILENMANVAWVYDVKGNSEFEDRCKILFNQSFEIDKLADGKIDYVKPLSKLGAGTISSRLTLRGDGWLRIYSHLSSYCHMDTGFAAHYIRGEVSGALNLFIFFSCLASIESVKMLVELLPLKDEARKSISSQLKRAEEEVENYKDKIGMNQIV